MDLYLLLVILLFGLATLDLVVGVSNDAVNFLNPSIGSKAGSMRTILIVASIGVLLGTIFSNGMMEVARKSVFHPEFFSYHALMFIFLSVMLTDVILLDVYNSLGFPTSTTVSLVFELFGAGAAIGFLSSLQGGLDPFNFDAYINVESTFRIIKGIFSSVGIAFLFGCIVQWLSRIIFSYRLESTLSKFGGIFTGLSATLIFNFLLLKGLKGSSLIGDSSMEWLQSYQNYLLFGLFILCASVGQYMISVRKLNPLRYIVLLGTFSLAMAFAGNDLVNFIGVAVAAFQAYGIYFSSGIDAHNLMMDAMASKVPTPTLLLTISGVIMIIALWTSAKARKVSATQIGLSRQGEGSEKFKSNSLSRSVVLGTTYLMSIVGTMSSRRFKLWTDSRFVVEPTERNTGIKENDRPAFDLLRASVDLMVASTLIAYATSLNLPLSTTYVVFMVSMGSTLADRSWGKESAVYRVAGVLNVIGGWLLTAVVAFVTAAIFATFLFYGEFISVMILLLIAVGLIVRSHMGFAKQMKAENRMEDEVSNLAINDNPSAASRSLIAADLGRSAQIVTIAGQSLLSNNKRNLKQLLNELNILGKRQKDIEFRLIRVLRKLEEKNKDVARMHMTAFDYACDFQQSALLTVESEYNHLANLHVVPHGSFTMNYSENLALFGVYASKIVIALNNGESEPHAELINSKRHIVMEINRALEMDLNLYRSGELTTRQVHLQTKLLLELRDMSALAYRIHKVYFG